VSPQRNGVTSIESRWIPAFAGMTIAEHQPARRRRRGFGADFPFGERSASRDDARGRRASLGSFALEPSNPDLRGGRFPGAGSAVSVVRRRRGTSDA
jgi:hypothetical protein